jgi:hypothetical protein
MTRALGHAILFVVVAILVLAPVSVLAQGGAGGAGPPEQSPDQAGNHNGGGSPNNGAQGADPENGQQGPSPHGQGSNGEAPPQQGGSPPRQEGHGPNGTPGGSHPTGPSGSPDGASNGGRPASDDPPPAQNQAHASGSSASQGSPHPPDRRANDTEAGASAHPEPRGPSTQGAPNATAAGDEPGDCHPLLDQALAPKVSGGRLRAATPAGTTPSQAAPAGCGGAGGQQHAIAPAEEPAPVRADGGSPSGPDRSGSASDPAAAPPDRTQWLQVHRGEAGNTLAWEPPGADEPAIKGYQVWRWDGAWSLIGQPGPGATGHHDPDGSADSPYKLTAYTERRLEAGYIGEGESPGDASWWREADRATPRMEVVPGTPAWVTWTAVIAAVTIVASLLVGMAAQRGPQNGNGAAHRIDGAARYALQRVLGHDAAQYLKPLLDLGVASVADLRARDADALSLWLGADMTLVQRWQASTVDAVPAAKERVVACTPLRVVTAAPRPSIANRILE